ncbi:MAG: hypothetical protein QM756_06420 [Polyangiaceae bacterium]
MTKVCSVAAYLNFAAQSVCLSALGLVLACSSTDSPAGSEPSGGSPSNAGSGGTQSGAGGAGGSTAGATSGFGGASMAGGNSSGGASVSNGGSLSASGGGGLSGGSGAVGGGGGVAAGGGGGVAGNATSGGNSAAGGGGGVAGSNSSSGGVSNSGGSTGGGVRVATVEKTRDLVPAPGMAGPVLKVDMDISGRQSSEVTEPGYTPWVVTNGASLATTIKGITFTFTKAGSNGTELAGAWQKAAVQAPNYARLAGDALTVSGGDAGSQIQLTLKGLAAGQHSLLAWHNIPGSAKAGAVSVSVNGSVQGSAVTESSSVLSNDAAPTSFVSFAAQAGKDVVILYSSTASLFINGFELDTPNKAEQATGPTPADADEHVDADSGKLDLKWKASKAAVSHDVYFGSDPNVVQSATHTSPEFKGNQAGLSYSVSNLSSIDRYYWRIDEINSSGLATRGNVWYFRPRHLAFPGAEGYGRYAIGGRGGPVVHVTNLNDSGAGSLRAAVENDIGPRTIVFDVAGVIKLASRLTQASSYVTVAGETAPGKGIMVRSAPFGFSGAHDSLMRFMRIRIGYGITYDGTGLQGGEYCIFDHDSVSWTIDESFSSRNAHNITLQKTLIAEALNIADHQNYPAGTAHGYAGTISGNIGSFHHNLLAHCEGRNFSMGSAIDGNNEFVSRLDLFNNVVYNFGGRANDGQVHQANFVNNYYKKGGATRIDFTFSMDLENYGVGTLQAYYAGNILQNTDGSFKCDGSNNTCGRRYTLTNGNPEPTWTIFPTSPAFFPSYATIHSAKDAFKIVLSDVGANQPVFDDHDTRIINETLTGTAKYKGSVSGLPGLPDRETDVGGFESYPESKRDAAWDSDADGLPDWWETAAGTNPKGASGNFTDSNSDLEGDGSTEMEEYLAFMAAPHQSTTPGKAVSVDVAKLFVGFSNGPSYSSPSATGGQVAISGTTATFTPSASACGVARFALKVTDKDNSTMTREVLVFVDAGAKCP